MPKGKEKKPKGKEKKPKGKEKKPKGKEKKPKVVNIAPLKGASPEYCPKCNSKHIHERRTKTKPKYKCGDCGHEFPNP